MLWLWRSLASPLQGRVLIPGTPAAGAFDPARCCGGALQKLSPWGPFSTQEIPVAVLLCCRFFAARCERNIWLLRSPNPLSSSAAVLVAGRTSALRPAVGLLSGIWYLVSAICCYASPQNPIIFLPPMSSYSMTFIKTALMWTTIQSAALQSLLVHRPSPGCSGNLL